VGSGLGGWVGGEAVGRRVGGPGGRLASGWWWPAGIGCRDGAGPGLIIWRAAARVVMRVAVTAVMIGCVEPAVVGPAVVGPVGGVCWMSPCAIGLADTPLLPARPASALACSPAAGSPRASSTVVPARPPPGPVARPPAPVVSLAASPRLSRVRPGRNAGGRFAGGGRGGSAADRAARALGRR